MSLNNPTLGKTAAGIGLAGAGDQGAILAGLAGKFTFLLDEGETFVSARIYDDNTFEAALTTYAVRGGRAATVVFGTHTSSGVTARRNYIEWTTTLGTNRRQFFVKNLPSSGSLYVANQECQLDEAEVYFSLGEDDPLAAYVSVAVNILPQFADEFFRELEFEQNRYANTRRNWGGAVTAQVLIDGGSQILETSIDRIHSFFWLPGTYGEHSIKVRLRALQGSTHYVDIDGTIRARQMPEPANLDPVGSVTLTLRFTPSEVGMQDATLYIESDDEAGTRAIKLRGTGIVAAPAVLTASPSGISFAEGRDGVEQSESFTVQNVGGTAVVITAAAISTNDPEAGFVLESPGLPLTLAPSQQTEFTVKSTPTGTGTFEGSVNILSSAGTLAVPLVAEVNAPRSDLQVIHSGNEDPEEIRFGNVLVGAEKIVTVTIDNLGDDYLDVTKIRVTGDADFQIQSGGEPAKIEPA